MDTILSVLTGFLFFFSGCAMGSFYNVLVDRLPAGQDIVRSRSECTFCHTTLRWTDLVPVFSYLFLRGRCRYCGAKLTIRYLLSELAVGGLFLLAFFRYRQTLDGAQLVSDLALWSMLFVTGVMDYREGIVIDQILLIFSLIGAAAQLLGRSPVRQLLPGAAVGFGFYGLIYLLARLFYKKEGFGMGDVLLLTAAGIFLGPISTLIAGFLAFYCSLLFLLVRKLQSRGTPLRGLELPFAPPVCAAVFLMSLFGTPITEFLQRLLGF